MGSRSKADGANRPPRPNEAAAGRRDDIDASASLPKKRFSAGEAIPLSFEIRNGSDHPITLWHSGIWPNHKVAVFGRDGKEPPLTPTGAGRRRAFRPNGPRRKNIPFELKAGESAESESPFLLDEIYQLEPGSYTCVVTYDDRQPPTPLRLDSPPIAFEVIPK